MRFQPATPAESLHTVSLRGRHLAPSWRSSAGKIGFGIPLKQGESANYEQSIHRLEAVLFLAREPVTSRKLAQLAQLEDGTQARTLVRQLNVSYDASGRAFRVEEVAGGYQLLTRQKFASWLRRLGHVPSENRLSAPALETLAVVAYRQPVLKADIEAIRGVHCGEILRQLMERDLVRIGDRSEELGRPYLYATTRRFLQQFGLRSLSELPRSEILRATSVPPVAKALSGGHHTSNNDLESLPTAVILRSVVDKESDVSVTLSPEMDYHEKLMRFARPAPLPNVRADEDDDFEDEEEEDDEEEDDLEDDLEEDEDDEEDDDDLEDEEWEEVEDEDDDDLDEDDEDWDDEEDEDWDDEEEEDDLDDDDDEEEDEDWEEAEEA